jgi:hypothetical protein
MTKLVLKCAMLLILVHGRSSAQLTYSFTTAGATGNFGPDQTEIDSAYGVTNLNNQVVSTNGIQTWTVPFTGKYLIEAMGAQGGGLPPTKFGGKGASMKGEFFFTAGTILKILVGQRGSSASNCYGGGGGSFVSTLTNSALIVAGGGGGAGGLGGGNGANASVGTSGTSGLAGGTGGQNGNGGNAVNTNGGSGAGFFTDGTGIFYMPECSVSVGQAFVNGGLGGQFDSWEPGGFGGGGSGFSGNGNGGGGGGYSGGGTSGSSYLGGGGGGSFNSGTNQANTPGVGTGDGIVIFTLLFRADIVQTSTISCFGYSTSVLSASLNGGTAPFSYSWLPGNATTSVISGVPAGIYTLNATDANNVTSSSIFTVTQPNASAVSISATKTLICNGDNTQLTVGGAQTYTWQNGSTNSITIISPDATINYSVSATDIAGCVNSQSIQIGVNNCTGFENFNMSSSNGKITLYPNPNNGEFTIYWENEVGSLIVITDASGKTVLNQKTELSNKIDLKYLNAGFYFVTITGESQQISHGRFIKQ